MSGPADGPTVVLGNSLGTSTDMWADALPVLEQHFRVVRYDHLGHGASPLPDGPYSIPLMAGQVGRLLDDLGIETAHHVGVSLGGAVAMHLAANEPRRVDRLALICTAADFGGPEVWHERAATVRNDGLAEVRDNSATRWFSSDFARSSRAVELLDALEHMPVEGYARCCEALAECDLHSELGMITASTLVVAGDLDVATPPERGFQLASKIAGPTTVELIPGGAHLLAVERADIVPQLLVDHFVG